MKVAEPRFPLLERSGQEVEFPSEFRGQLKNAEVRRRHSRPSHVFCHRRSTRAGHPLAVNAVASQPAAVGGIGVDVLVVRRAQEPIQRIVDFPIEAGAVTEHFGIAKRRIRRAGSVFIDHPETNLTVRLKVTEERSLVIHINTFRVRDGTPGHRSLRAERRMKFTASYRQALQLGWYLAYIMLIQINFFEKSPVMVW